MTNNQPQLTDQQAGIAAGDGHHAKRQAARGELFEAAHNAPKRDQFGSYTDWQQAFDDYQAETMGPLRQALREAKAHDWNYRGYCEDCGATQPDYEPGDNHMPALATTTDPWDQP